MSVSVKVEAIDRDIDLMLKESLSPQAQSKIFADFARQQLALGEQHNQTILGRIPGHKTFVDGSEGADEDRVRPDGIIQYEFQIVTDVFKWIAQQLVLHAPVKTGRFAKSFTFFADGQEVDVGGTIPTDATEFVFLSPLPYARKIERGESKQAPDGVFQAVADLARARFGNIAKIYFVYRAPLGGAFLTARQGGNKSENRVPAISISLK